MVLAVASPYRWLLDNCRLTESSSAYNNYLYLTDQQRIVTLIREAGRYYILPKDDQEANGGKGSFNVPFITL